MLAPIKVDEIAQNWKTFLHAKNIQYWCKFLGIGTLCLYRCQNGSKKPLFFSHSTARWNHGSKWNPVMMKHNDPLYQPRYHLSGLIQRIWSYLATTKACSTQDFLLAPMPIYYKISFWITHTFSERKVCRGGHLRWKVYILQHRPTEILHHDPCPVHKGQKQAGQESHGDRAHAGGR